MPMIDVYAATGTFASKHDLAQQLAAAVMRRGRCPLSRIAHYPKKETSHASLNRLSHQDTGTPSSRCGRVLPGSLAA
jgi:hypothetical protein